MENQQPATLNTQPPLHKKHLGFFWPLVALLIIASVVAGAVVWLSHESVLSDEISSMVIKIHKPEKQGTEKTVEVKTEKTR